VNQTCSHLCGLPEELELGFGWIITFFMQLANQLAIMYWGISSIFYFPIILQADISI
jgi:hypothetical protein